MKYISQPPRAKYCIDDAPRLFDGGIKRCRVLEAINVS